MLAQLDQANPVLGGAPPPAPQMIAFVEKHREADGVNSTCRVLLIASSH